MKKSIRLFFICILTTQAQYSISMHTEERPLPTPPSSKRISTYNRPLPDIPEELNPQDSRPLPQTPPHSPEQTLPKNPRPLAEIVSGKTYIYKTLPKNPTLTEVVEFYDSEKVLMHPNDIDYTEQQFKNALCMPEKDLNKHLTHYFELLTKIIHEPKRSALTAFTPEKYNMYVTIYGSHASDTDNQEWTLKTLWSITTGANLHQKEYTSSTELDRDMYATKIKYKKSFILKELKKYGLI